MVTIAQIEEAKRRGFISEARRLLAQYEREQRVRRDSDDGLGEVVDLAAGMLIGSALSSLFDSSDGSSDSGSDFSGGGGDFGGGGAGGDY